MGDYLSVGGSRCWPFYVCAKGRNTFFGGSLFLPTELLFRKGTKERYQLKDAIMKVVKRQQSAILDQFSLLTFLMIIGVKDRMFECVCLSATLNHLTFMPKCPFSGDDLLRDG